MEKQPVRNNNPFIGFIGSVIIFALHSKRNAEDVKARKAFG